MKKSLLFTACLSCLAASVSAQPTAYQAPMGYGQLMPQQRAATRMPQHKKGAADIEEAGVILKAGLDKILGFFDAGKKPTRMQIAKFLSKDIAPYFDFAYMAKWSAGGRYLRMSEPQKKEIETELRSLFMAAMAQKLSSFKHQTVNYLAPRRTGRNQVELSIAIGDSRSFPARLDFRLYRGGDGWKVYDVSANGSSALMFYRQYFRQQRQRQRLPERFKR